jgi:hypothetical protein
MHVTATHFNTEKLESSKKVQIPTEDRIFINVSTYAKFIDNNNIVID